MPNYTRTEAPNFTNNTTNITTSLLTTRLNSNIMEQLKKDASHIANTLDEVKNLQNRLKKLLETMQKLTTSDHLPVAHVSYLSNRSTQSN